MNDEFISNHPSPNDTQPDGMQFLQGSSPYSSGGGGVTFERRVAARYLTLLLTGTTVAELEGRRVTRVAFQQAPDRPVDDLVIYATRDGETNPSLELAIAVRRAPKFVTSDTSTSELVTKFLQAMRFAEKAGTDVEHLFTICVAGPQKASSQVAKLATLAKDHRADSFFSVLRAPGKFRKELRIRLSHLVNLIKSGLATLGESASIEMAERATWSLLGRLHVLTPRVEAPNLEDWEDLLRMLEPWARDHSVPAATALRDRLESLAARYASNAAVVELPALRRDAHDVLSSNQHRNKLGWDALMRLDQDAQDAVRIEIGLGLDSARLHLTRKAEAEALRKRLESNDAVLVYGGSGVGKSALVLSELKAALAADSLRLQVAFINLRRMPLTISELRRTIGCAIEDVLREISAPSRLLVIDAAEYIAESRSELLSHLVRAAKISDMRVWIISSTEGHEAVRTAVETIFPVIEHQISPLKDEDLEELSAAFPQLRSLVGNAHSRELLRRPVIADFLVRASSTDHPLSDADALKIVWEKLVRAGGHTERGTPDSREQVFRRLARHQLFQPLPGSEDELYESLDPTALDGLRRDGLVRSASVASWLALPDFSHELLRTYAICKVLLAYGEPVTVLLEAGAPRWALPAARLAAQVLFAENSKVPIDHRFEKIQTDFDRLVAAGHGHRWSDLPTEAVLPLPRVQELIGGAWEQLLENDAKGLRRILRVIQQRHRNDKLVTEPLIDLLLDRSWPNEEDLQTVIEELQCDWLRALIAANASAGQALRLKLRRSILQSVQKEDQQLAEQATKEAARLAARSPEQVREDEERMKEFRRYSVRFCGSERRSVELPWELIREATLERLSLLGADLGEEGEELLRRVARDAPHRLAPSLEEIFTAWGLALYRPSLLTELVEAYYLDPCDSDLGTRIYDWGIRGHYGRSSFGSLCAYHKGPFLAMLKSDFRNGVACLNRLLNHAARIRAGVLLDRPWDQSKAFTTNNPFQRVLSITGEPKTYVGDSHVWRWYRGTGVGPYPCMSALQALEVVCDQLIMAGTRPEYLARVLLRDCENLAMPAFVVGILVRHLEAAGDALDPFFTEPSIWRLEFERVVSEYSSLAASSEHVRAPERRKWSLREAGIFLGLRAGGERIDSLRRLGQRLIERACELEADEQAELGDGEESSLSENLAAVHAWAAALDQSSYQVNEHEGGILIQTSIPDNVQQALEPGNRDLSRGDQATQILLRYTREQHRLSGPPRVSSTELQSDLATARDLLANPPAASPAGPLAAPAAVAAGALELHYIAGQSVQSHDLLWSMQLLLHIVDLCASLEDSQNYFSIFSQSPDRSAARGIPLIFLPDASFLRADLCASGITATDLAEAARWLVTNSSLEARLLYAKAMDSTWRAPCNDEIPEKCHHGLAFELLENSARDCVIGSWDFEAQKSTLEHLDGPLDQAIIIVPDDKILVQNLSPAIRALGVAANTPNCCTVRARALLSTLLAAHRRGMMAHKQRYMHSASDALIVARALLGEAADGREDCLHSHVKHYVGNSDLLSELLQALAAAAEENSRAANTARRIWPELIGQVLDLFATGRYPRRQGYFESADLAALIPNKAYDFGYLRRELEGEPIAWTDLIAWRKQVEYWLSFAAGSSRCLDSLIKALSTLTETQQPVVGLPWVESLIQADPGEIASGSWLLPDWLRNLRPHLRNPEELSCWQRIVDMLVVGGDTRVTSLSD